METPERQGRLLAIAVRTERIGPMRLLDFARVCENEGIEGDLPARPERGVTLLCDKHWQEVTRLLGTPLPWHTRRANLLVRGFDMKRLAGKRLVIGKVELEVCGETKPCSLMDQLHPGLREALEPDWRGGVHARVLSSGSISVGDAITVA